MDNQQKIKYALIGGLSLVAAAVAFHWMGKA
jgi:hypothetical protein